MEKIGEEFSLEGESDNIAQVKDQEQEAYIIEKNHN